MNGLLMERMRSVILRSSCLHCHNILGKEVDIIQISFQYVPLFFSHLKPGITLSYWGCCVKLKTWNVSMVTSGIAIWQ
jgi:hypothetical protein